MAKTQVTLTIDKEVKEKFQKLAKKLGSNMSTLTNMYYTQVILTGRVEYEVEDTDFEMGVIEYSELTEEDKVLFHASKQSTQRINI